MRPLGISGLGLYKTINRVLKASRPQVLTFGTRRTAHRVIAPAVCFAALTTVAVSVLLGRTVGRYGLVFAMVMLVINASSDAWDSLLRLREPTPGPRERPVPAVS